jgi:hypothetical protein
MRTSNQRRRGTVILLTAFLMIVMMALLAMAVDIGYVYTVRSEMQRTADASAIAAAWELLDPETIVTGDNSERVVNAQTAASTYAAKNWVGSAAPLLAAADVKVGHMSNLSDPNTLDVSNQTSSNAVEIRVRKHADQNGKVRLFFAHVLGKNGIETEAKATAAFCSSIGGFRQIQEGESNLEILPFALDEDTWNALMAGSATDSYSYNSETKTVSTGSDGVKEVNLFPQGTGSPGNRGTIDIGGANNSTSDISRQIRTGISASDMAAFVNDDRTLEFNDDGKLWLNGDTGISAAVKDDLESIKGKPRIIPIFRSVCGNGNNAEYTIVKFVGVRVMYVKLTGSMNSKKVMIQPCMVVSKGAVPSTDTSMSTFIYSPPWLVQ